MFSSISPKTPSVILPTYIESEELSSQSYVEIFIRELLDWDKVKAPLLRVVSGLMITAWSWTYLNRPEKMDTSSSTDPDLTTISTSSYTQKFFGDAGIITGSALIASSIVQIASKAAEKQAKTHRKNEALIILPFVINHMITKTSKFMEWLDPEYTADSSLMEILKAKLTVLKAEFVKFQLNPEEITISAAFAEALKITHYLIEHAQYYFWNEDSLKYREISLLIFCKQQLEVLRKDVLFACTLLNSKSEKERLEKASLVQLIEGLNEDYNKLQVNQNHPTALNDFYEKFKNINKIIANIGKDLNTYFSAPIA